MDPFSIVIGTVPIIPIILNTLDSTRKFIDNTKDVDVTIRCYRSKIESLSSDIASIRKEYDAAKRTVLSESQLENWENVGFKSSEFDKTLKEFSEILDHVSHGKFMKARVLKGKAVDIMRCQDMLNTHFQS